MTTKTFRLSGKAMDRPWHVIDARGRPLGRVASEAAKLLMGKHKPTYEPHLAMGDFVIIVNAREVAFTGNKAQQKIYYRHSGYPGGLKQRTLQEQMDRDPRRVLEKAIKGMLPGTSLGRELFRHLKVYAGPTHPHEAQVRAGMGTKKPRAEVTSGAQAATADAPTAADEAPPIEDSTVETTVEETAVPDTVEATTEAPEAMDAEETATNTDDEEQSESV